MSTRENLADAFAGESQANRKYLAFATQAQQEGLPEVAKLFRAAAHAETVHAHAHLRAMGGVKKTAENLEAAINGEGFEFQVMYPPYLQQAQQDGSKAAEISFRNALAVEEIHYRLYSEALSAVQAGTDLQQRKVHVCEICGNTVYGDVPERCEVCGVGREKFSEIC